MKRNIPHYSDSESEYSDNPEEEETPDEDTHDEDTPDEDTPDEDDEGAYYSENDAEILKKSGLIFVLNSLKNNPPPAKKEHKHKDKKIKTDIDIKREKIQKEINSINLSVDQNINDRILFSNIPIQKKASMLSEIGKYSGSDKTKYLSYVDKVLSVPTGVVKPVINRLDKAPEFLLTLRKNMDDTIYGHYDTKEEIIDHVSSLFTNPNAKGNVLALQSSPGMGKCHAKDTGILMFNGEIKMVQNLEIGDEIMGDDSTPRKVMSLGSGRDIMYEIHHQFSNIKYVVNSEHILCLKNSDGEDVETMVKDFIKKPLNVQSTHHGFSNAINFIGRKTSGNPYEQGVNLLKSGVVSVPAEYKINSFNVRCCFLAGVIDAHGIRNINCVQILLPNAEAPKQIVDDILFISRSLGYITKHLVISNVNVITIRGEYLVYLKYPSLYNNFSSKEPIIITQLEEGDYYGMTIDGNNRYVMDNMIVTHNTKFARALGNSLGLPFNQISLGGISDPSILVGHDYTYIGSKPGRIYDAIVKSKCMNPVIYLDECDKIPENKITELNGILTHLLDKEQNMDFKDNYLADISMDLSKVLFILSFNDEKSIDPVVFNRLKVIKIKENTLEEKVQIVKKFTIKEICQNLGLSPDKFIITDETIKHIINNTAKEPGMRKITRNFETIFNKINTKALIEKSDISHEITQGFRGENSKLKYNHDDRIVVDNGFVDNYIFKEDELPHHHFMYM